MAKKLLLLLTFCIISATTILAQDANISIADTSSWYKTPLQFINGSIKFPYKTTMDKKSIYTEKGLQTQYLFKAEHKALDLQFEVSLRPLISIKEAKTAIKEEIQRITVENGAYPITDKAIDNKGRAYTSVSIVTPDKKTSNYRIYILDDYLTTVTGSYFGKNNYTAIFNYFFNSLEYNPTEIITNNNSKDKKTKSKNKNITNWQSFAYDGFECQFPNEPKLKKDVIASNDTVKYIVNNYYFQDESNNVSYLISQRNYEQQQNADSLIQIAFQALSNYINPKIEEEKESWLIRANNREYVFKYNKIYYRVRYIYSNDSLYQLLVVGNKKSVNQIKNANFFEQFIVSN
ncbi:MAG: hypothetical protein H6553_11255 [Chitinophagales bacterium]|nr:hypothetical protein [Chitinophagales bacterium]